MLPGGKDGAEPSQDAKTTSWPGSPLPQVPSTSQFNLFPLQKFREVLGKVSFLPC